MRTRHAWFIGLLVLLLGGQCLAATVLGTVFFDRNGNGSRDPGEPPIADTAVSDGRQVVLTSARGEYRLETDRGRIVFVSLPRGYRAVGDFYKEIERDCILDFPMAEWPESRADSVRFAQITDIHMTGDTTLETFVEDLAEINSLHPAAQFILATGDLVNNGKNLPEYESYVKGVKTSRLPVFSVPGNHDVSLDPTGSNYQRFLGPLYYSFNVGNGHFVVLNCVNFSDEQKAWIASDLAAAPKGSRSIFSMHYLPTQAQMDYLAQLGASAVLSGHWHGDRVRESHGVLDLNTPPLRFGGIDRTARSFRIVELRDEISSELRFGGFMHHATVVSPSGQCLARNGKIQVVVNAYDSRCKAASVTCMVGGRRISLRPEGAWSWFGELPASAEIESPQRLVAEIRDTKGDVWRAESDFQLVRPESPTSQPLRLAAVEPTGGLIALSSPKTGGGIIAIGVNDHGDLEDCGVRAFSEALAPRWTFHTDSGIKNNVAVSTDRVYATTVAGWLYALDLKTGKPAWKAGLDLERERWEVAATTVEDDVVFTGGGSYVAAFDAATGERIWFTSLTKSDWWPSCYVVPTPTDGRLILMTRAGAHAFEAKTGKPLWNLAGRFNGCAVSGGVIYTTKDDVPAAVDASNGTLLWTGTDKVGDTASVAAVSGDRFVLGTADGRVCAYSTKDGSPLWSFQTGPTLSTLQPYKRDTSDVNSSPVIAGGIVYVGASDGVLYALSLATGEKVGSYDLGSPIASSPLAHAGRFYIAAYDGNLYAFDLTAK